MTEGSRPTTASKSFAGVAYRAAVPSSGESVRPWPEATAFLAIAVVGLLNILLFFRHSIFSGFEQISGDALDGRLQIAILEHWHHVFMLQASWRNPIFFYPHRGVLGYNDAYFLYGAVYSFWRLLGAGWFTAYELVAITVKAVGYISFVYLCRNVLNVRLYLAILGGSLFCQLSSTETQLNHSQLLTVCFVPLLLILLCHFLNGFSPKRRRQILVFGTLAIVFYGAWLMTAFYMAWFFALFAATAAVFYFLTCGADARWGLFRAAAHCWMELLGLGILAVIVAVPFMLTYWATARETGMHPYSELLSYVGTPLDVLNVSEGNWLYGKAADWLSNFVSGKGMTPGERSTGFTPVLLGVFASSLFFLVRRERIVDRRVISAVILAFIVLWAASVRWGSVLPWYLIFAYIPGAGAVRVLPRFQIFVGFFVVLCAVLLLDRVRWLAHPLIGAAIGAVLLVEQYNVSYGHGLTQQSENWVFAAIPHPPADCRSFFIRRPLPRLDWPQGARLDHSYGTDAMIVAERFNLPTLNGHDSFLPGDWDLSGGNVPDYLARVRSYAKAHGIAEGLCSLDVPDGIWAAFDTSQAE